MLACISVGLTPFFPERIFPSFRSYTRTLGTSPSLVTPRGIRRLMPVLLLSGVWIGSRNPMWLELMSFICVVSFSSPLMPPTSPPSVVVERKLEIISRGLIWSSVRPRDPVKASLTGLPNISEVMMSRILSLRSMLLRALLWIILRALLREIFSSTKLSIPTSLLKDRESRSSGASSPLDTARILREACNNAEPSTSVAAIPRVCLALSGSILVLPNSLITALAMSLYFSLLAAVMPCSLIFL